MGAMELGLEQVQDLSSPYETKRFFVLRECSIKQYAISTENGRVVGS